MSVCVFLCVSVCFCVCMYVCVCVSVQHMNISNRMSQSGI